MAEPVRAYSEPYVSQPIAQERRKAEFNAVELGELDGVGVPPRGDPRLLHGRHVSPG